MHLLASQILAESDDFPSKPVFIAIAFAIWIVSSIVSSIRKTNTAKKQQQLKASLGRTRQAIQLPALAQSHPNWKGGKTASARVPGARMSVAKPPVKRTAPRRPPPLPQKAAAPRE